MSDRLQAWRRVRSGERESVADWDRDANSLPAAAQRGARSFYDDLVNAPEALRICHGTSCKLAGADELHASLSEVSPCRTAYCLGYCDRSPVVLTPEGEVLYKPTAEHMASGSQHASMDPVPRIRSAVNAPIVTRRILNESAADLETARAAGAYVALEKAVAEGPEAILTTIEGSGERGRGGAAYPTGVKWRACANASSDRKFVIANGDEGDPGSYIDRVLMEMDPHAILEGMAIAAIAVGACEGIVFVRSEYPRADAILRKAIADAEAAGVLGDSLCGSERAFSIRVFTAMGSYVCGEETAMLNALEGNRGEVRLRPPYPAESGLFGQPTLVDNVETLVNVPWIIEHGAEAYRALGTEGSNGTKALCLNHGFAQHGIVEVEFGTSLKRVVEEFGGVPGGTQIDSVILGGPMGSIVDQADLDVPICYDAMDARGISLGHGGLVALHEGTDWRGLLKHWLEFMVHESCGKCVPCRLGSQRALDWANEAGFDARDPRFDEVLDLMEGASLCAFGKEMPKPMRSILARVNREDGS